MVHRGRPETSPLEIYQVNVPVPDDTYDIDSITQRIKFDEGTKLVKLSKLNGGFPDSHIHILVLVEYPEGESLSSRPGYDVVEIIPSLTRRIPPIIIGILHDNSFAT